MSCQCALGCILYSAANVPSLTHQAPFQASLTPTPPPWAPQAFFAPTPVNCSLYPSNGKPAFVFRWYSGFAPAGAKLAIASCGTVVGSMQPLVSVRSSAYANAGPYTCLG